MQSTSKNARFLFLDYLRVIAVLLVVYDHLCGAYPKTKGYNFLPHNYIEKFINVPLGIIQDFGFLGVSIFFVISGFIITHVSIKESATEFFIKRVFRIYPTLIIAIIIILILDPTLARSLTFTDILANATLVNYWLSPQIIVVGVAWSLVVEILFYALMLLTHVLRNKPNQRVISILFFLFLVIYSCRAFGANFFLFAASASYIAILCVGQILYYSGHQKSIKYRHSVLYLIACYVLFLFSLNQIHTIFLPINNSYLISAFSAIFLFYLFWRFEENMFNFRILTNYFIRPVANFSYPLYLFHGTLGVYILDKTVVYFGIYYSLLIAFFSATIFSYLIHTYFETFFLNLAKKIVTGYKL